MPLGPGKYDAEVTMVREKLAAEGVILLVFNGNKGGGFSCQLTAELLLHVPAMLRDIAKQIEESGEHI
jgi:hypothetical protein